MIRKRKREGGEAGESLYELLDRLPVADAPNITGMTAVATHFCKCSDGTASTCLSTDCAGTPSSSMV